MKRSDGKLECRECKTISAPPDIVPYLVKNQEGKNIHIWLHPACSPKWHAKYRAWLAELAAERK